MSSKLDNQFSLVIEAGKSGHHYWTDIWHYRDLFYFLVWRDILVRYKQTVIGVAWVVIRPIMTMLVFTLVFGKLAKLPSDGVPYSLLVFSGMLPWFFFSSALSESSNSMVLSTASPRAVALRAGGSHLSHCGGAASAVWPATGAPRDQGNR